MIWKLGLQRSHESVDEMWSLVELTVRRIDDTYCGASCHHNLSTNLSFHGENTCHDYYDDHWPMMTVGADIVLGHYLTLHALFVQA